MKEEKPQYLQNLEFRINQLANELTKLNHKFLSKITEEKWDDVANLEDTIEDMNGDLVVLCMLKETLYQDYQLIVIKFTLWKK